MPYKTNHELPEPVKSHLPEHAQTIYRKAFNNAWKEYADAKDRREGQSREETSHQVAWAAVKHSYEKEDETGEWKEKA